MITYRDTIKGRIFQYFYDYSIKLWTVHEVDYKGNQVCMEGDYFQNKAIMKVQYKFKFTRHES